MSDTTSPRFVPADHLGSRVELYPHADGYRANVKTTYGVKPAFVADVILIDGDNNEAGTFDSQLIFNVGIVADLRKAVDGEPVTGVLQRVETAVGRTAIVVR